MEGEKALTAFFLRATTTPRRALHTGFEDAGNFAQDGGRVRNAAEHEGGDHGVEGAVVKRQRFADAL